MGFLSRASALRNMESTGDCPDRCDDDHQREGIYGRRFGKKPGDNPKYTDYDSEYAQQKSDEPCFTILHVALHQDA